MRRFTRNQVATAIAAFAAVAGVGAPLLGIVAIWTSDARWLETAGASLVLGLVLFAVGYMLFDESEDGE